MLKPKGSQLHYNFNSIGFFGYITTGKHKKNIGTCRMDTHEHSI